MKKAFLLLLFALLVLPLFAEECIVLKAAGPIVMDGKPDEADWKRAEKLEGKQVKTGSDCPRKTWFKILYDSEYLYFGGYFEDKYVQASIPKKASEPYKFSDSAKDPDYANLIFAHDSCVEIYLDPDADGKRYLGLHINAAGKVNDFYIDDSKPTKNGLDTTPNNLHLTWNIDGLKAETYVYGTLNNKEDEDTGWTFEAALPIKTLKKFFKRGMGKVIEKEVLSILFDRVDTDGKDYYYHTWPVIGETNCHKTDKYGILKLENENK